MGLEPVLVLALGVWEWKHTEALRLFIIVHYYGDGIGSHGRR